jgi:hypothetical protein
MRTTVTLDPDTEALIRREIARSGVTFKRVVNEAIRRGLAGVRGGKREQIEVRTFRSGYQPGIDRLRLQQLADDLEAAEAAGRAARRR